MDNWMARHPGWVLAGAIALLAVLYVRLLGYGILRSFDDVLYLFNRPEVRHWWDVPWTRRLMTTDTGYGIPIPTFVYYQIQSAFPETWLPILRSLQVGGHLLNAYLLWRLVRRWWDDRTAAAVAGLWAIHPVAVETVAWLTNLKGVLFGTFTLLALLVWQKLLDGEQPWARPVVGVGYTFVTAMLALGCRPDAVVIPPLLVLLTFRHGELRQRWRSLLAVCGPLLVAVAIYLPFAMSGQASVITGMELRESLLRDRWIRVTQALELAVKNVLVPVDLDPWYFLRRRETLWRTLPGGVILVGLVILLVGLALRRRWTIWFPLALAAISYGPYAQLVPLPRISADSYLYVPSIGGLAFVVLVVRDAIYPRVVDKFSESSARRWLAGLAVVTFAGLGALTHRQLARWRNPIELWGPVLEEHPKAWRPYVHMAKFFADRGDYERAHMLLKEGLPTIQKARQYPAFLTVVYEKVGRPRRALQLAIETLARHRAPQPSHSRRFFEILVGHDLELPENEVVAELVPRATEMFRRAPRMMGDRAFRLDVADWLIRHDRPESGARLLQLEFRERRPKCRAWKLAGELPETQLQDVEVPTRPDRC